MRKSIVIVGDSPLSVLIGRELERDLARQSHIEITHISRDDSFIYSPAITSLLGRVDIPSKKELYRYVGLKLGTVRQINLADRRIITTSGIFHYDFLCLDLTPSYTAKQINNIAGQIKRLIHGIQAKLNLGARLRARVNFIGEDLMSCQMALALSSDLNVLPVAVRRSVTIEAPLSADVASKHFLGSDNVFSRPEGLLPGLTVRAPCPPLPNRSIRGALLDEKNRFILGPALNPEGYPELIVIERSSKERQNILRVERTLAKVIVSNIERFLSGNRQRPINYPRPSGILSGQMNDYVWIGSLQSRRLRAKLIAALDRKFYRQLFG